MTKTYSKTRILVEGALMIALSTVLSMIQILSLIHICTTSWVLVSTTTFSPRLSTRSDRAA